jgi:hypothetical protein
MRRFELGERLGEFGQGQSLLPEPFGHSQASTDIDGVHVPEALRQRSQRLAH